MNLISRAVIHIESEEKGETLEFRNGEVMDFYTNFEEAYDLRRSGFLYAVRLVRIPDLPAPAASNNTGFTVIACRQFDKEGVWGWINLPERTKNVIGEHLLLMLGTPDYNLVERWVYLIIRRPKEHLIAETIEFKSKIIPYQKPFWLTVEKLLIDDVNYACRIDLSVCPMSIYEKIVSNTKPIESILEEMGYLEVSQISMLYKRPDIE